MSAEHDKGVLLRAFECKTRSKFNVQEFLDLVKADTNLTKLSEKGLYIGYLVDLLLKAYLTHCLKIRNFTSEFEQREVKKRQRREGGGEYRRRRPKRAEVERGDKTLEELSSESLSNPSNISNPERARINVDGRPEELSGQVPPSKEKSDDSNGSRENNMNPLKLSLNNISEVERGNEETFVPDNDFMHGGIEENSQSSSQYSGEISNLSEKIKIFTSDRDEPRTTATRRKAGNRDGTLSRETRTKKKMFNIIDQSTLLEDTRDSENDATINYTEISRFDTQDREDFDLTHNFLQNIDIGEKEFFDKFLQKDKIEALKSLVQVDRPFEPIEYGDMMPIDSDLAYPDYTMSQPTSAPNFSQDFFKESLEIKDSEFTFNDLVHHSNKDKATLFYQLLWREQNDEICLNQNKPEEFSSIKIKQK